MRRPCSLLLTILTLSCTLIVLACSSKTEDTKESWQKIAGRDTSDSIERIPIYQAKTPLNWVRKDPSLNESIIDTKKALCEYLIEDEEGSIRLTVHNFPSQTIDQRISPHLQIQRWKNQFEQLDPALTSVTSSSHGGFVGLFLEGTGTLNGMQTSILGWSMQLSSEHYRHLQQEATAINWQRRADYTIKVLGPPHSLSKHRDTLIEFASSFELIDELPSPL